MRTGCNECIEVRQTVSSSIMSGDAELDKAMTTAMPYMIYSLVANDTRDTVPIEQLFMFLKKKNIPFLHNRERTIESIEDYLQQYYNVNNYRELAWTLDVWGAAIWDFLHKASLYFNAARERLNLFSFLIMNLNFIIPCQKCACHFTDARDRGQMENIFDMLDRNPVRAVFDLHNSISARVHPERPLFTDNEFATKYKPF